MVSDAKMQLIADAEALAAEHGHALGEWYTSEHLLIAARCQHCTATVCLRDNGYGSNDDPLRWLRERECERNQPRFRVRRSGKAFVVIDIENPKGVVALVKREAQAKKIASVRNIAMAEPAHAVVQLREHRVKLRAKVDRLRKQLAQAEAELEAVAA